MIQILLAALLTASPCEVASPIDHGAKSPCEGILVPSHQALECVRLVEVGLPTCVADLAHCQAGNSGRVESLEAQLMDSRERVGRLSAELVKLNMPDPPWKHPALWFTVGVVVSGAVVIMSIDVNSK